MPGGNIFVGDTGSDVEHDDTALAVDVVSITETTELLLTSGIPNIELNLTEVLKRGLVTSSMNKEWRTDRVTHGGEAERVNVDSKSGNVLLLEFASQVALDKGGL